MLIPPRAGTRHVPLAITRPADGEATFGVADADAISGNAALTDASDCSALRSAVRSSSESAPHPVCAESISANVLSADAGGMQRSSTSARMSARCRRIAVVLSNRIGAGPSESWQERHRVTKRSAMSAAVGEGSSFSGGAAELVTADLVTEKLVTEKLVTEKLTTEKPTTENRSAPQISALARAIENFSGKIR